MPRRTPPLTAIAALLIGSTLVSGQRSAPNPRQAFEGIWNSATATPLERPAAL